MKLKRFFAVVLLLLMSSFAASAFASGIYDYDPEFSPYYAGSVKSSVLYDALDELNYIRWLVGVPDNVTLDYEFTRRAQHGAVLLDAIDTLTHTPGKPSDMSTSFYELAYDSTTHGNIAVSQIYRGSEVWGNMSLSYSTKGYMDDSDDYNISRVGHRRWLMNPRMTRTGFGISTRRGYAVTYVIDEYNSLDWPISDEYITWPAHKHFHPLTYFYADTAWSVTLNRNVFATVAPSDVTVRLTRQRDGETWIFSSSGSDGDFYVTDDSIAYDQCIIFRPDGISDYRNGELWRVSISGLPRLDGSIDAISYTVEFSSELTGYEEDEYTEYDYGPQSTSKRSSGGGGCNSGFGAMIAVLVLGIPRKNSRAGQ